MIDRVGINRKRSSYTREKEKRKVNNMMACK